jgi:hypothetical protein
LVIFPVLGLFRYRRNPGAPGLAVQVGPGVPGLFLPAYSWELYLIERPRKVAKRCTGTDWRQLEFPGDDN